MNKNFFPKIACIILVAILFTGCGNVPQPGSNDVESEMIETEAIGPYYSLTETELPDCQEALCASGILVDANWFIQELESGFVDGQMYCLSRLKEWVDDKDILRGECVQIMSTPYQEWQSYYISPTMWIEGNDLYVESIANIHEDGMLLILISQEGEQYLGYYRWDSSGEMLGKLSSKLTNASWYYEEGKIYAFTNRGSIMTVFDENYQEQSMENLEYSVSGRMKKNTGDGWLWYGYNPEGILVWDGLKGKEIAKITDGPNRFAFQIARTQEDTIILADEQAVWLHAQETKELFHFYEKDYVIDKLLGIGVTEKGEILFLAEYEGARYLLTATESDEAEKSELQEITLALSLESSFFQKLVASYNRKSERYHVSVIYPQNGESLEEFATQIQLEMSSGRGPDLISDYIVDIEGAIQQGFFQNLEGVVTDKEPFIDSAFQQGIIEDVTYGIPYSCGFYFLAVSKELGEGALCWTLNEMIEAVNDSDAKIFCQGMNGVDIVMNCGLFDESNKAFIDWEKGESYLTEQPFLDLLAFVKAYADPQNYARSDVGHMLLEGQIAAMNIYVFDLGQMEYAEACFEGNTCYVGYPREDGAGIYMVSENLYMNQASEKREGVEDFLSYILSEEGQTMYMKYCDWGRLSVRRGVIEENISEYAKTKYTVNQHHDSNEIYWTEDGLDEQQEALFWRLLDSAIPNNFHANKLYTMVSEELEPFFQGVKNAEEVAATLDSRVQLYLDERKQY